MNEQMEEAMAAATKEALSANKAADLQCPSVYTEGLFKWSCCSWSKRGPGPMPYPTAKEEAELSSHLLQASDTVLGKTRQDVLTSVGTC